MNHFSLKLIAIFALLLCQIPVLAQDNWPTKPIRIVVPYTPGGGTDAVTRQLAERLASDAAATPRWAFVIDNKPGASGNVGLDWVAKSRADGYTLGMGQTANLAINPAALAKMPTAMLFDAGKDFVPVALVAEVPMLMVVRQESPWKTLADVLAKARAQPGQVKQALAGTGTVGHLAGEMLSRRAGIQVLNVPYKGAAPALADLMGGHTDYMFSTPQAVMGLIKGGKLRALAVSSARRLGVLPDVPTVAESGFAGFAATDWKMLVAPAGTPAEHVKRLNAAVDKALAHPGLQSQLAAEGSTALGGGLGKVAAHLASEQAAWATLIKEAGIVLE
jgi:tripartite-type tricarboxylate transporter receptor subunit TctC